MIAYLEGSEFSGSEFSRSDFSGSDFSGSEFSGSEFSESEFSGSEFSGSEFSGCCLSTWRDHNTFIPLLDHFSFLGDRGRVHDFEHEQRLVYDFTNRGPCYANSRTAELDPSSHQLC